MLYIVERDWTQFIINHEEIESRFVRGCPRSLNPPEPTEKRYTTPLPLKTPPSPGEAKK